MRQAALFLAFFLVLAPSAPALAAGHAKGGQAWQAQAPTAPGPAFIVVHGLGDSARVMEPLRERIARHGHPTISVTLSGHDTRPEDLIDVSAEAWRDDVDRALEQARAQGRKAVIVGLSAGGALAIDAAARHADLVVGLLLISPAIAFKSPRLAALSCVLKSLYTWTQDFPGQSDLGSDEIVEDNPNRYRKTASNGVCQVTRVAKKVRSFLETGGFLREHPMPVFLATWDADPTTDATFSRQAFRNLVANGALASGQLSELDLAAGEPAAHALNCPERNPRSYLKVLDAAEDFVTARFGI